MTGFVARLRAAWDEQDSLACVGLDPLIERLPAHIAAHASPIFHFSKAIIDATADLVCAYKPQFAHYAACEAEDQLERTIEYIHRAYPGIPVILDAKRGDVGSTAERYAIEAFERYGADAVTVNPYLGGDSLEPFLRFEDKGVLVVCRTSNPGARDLQDLDVTVKPSWPASWSWWPSLPPPAGTAAATASSSWVRLIRRSWPRFAPSQATCPFSCLASGRRGPISAPPSRPDRAPMGAVSS